MTFLGLIVFKDVQGFIRFMVLESFFFVSSDLILPVLLNVAAQLLEQNRGLVVDSPHCKQADVHLTLDAFQHDMLQNLLTCPDRDGANWVEHCSQIKMIDIDFSK